MKVKELIKKLKDFDDETEVIFADYERVVDVKCIIAGDEEYAVITDRK